MARRCRPLLALLPVAPVALLGAACSSSGNSNAAAPGVCPADRPTVVVTTSILGDVTRNVIGDQANLVVLVPNGTDPHEYEPSAAEAAQLRSADLVVANGLGLEERLTSTLDAARSSGVRVLEVGPRLNPLPLDEGEGQDPHVWMDPDRMTQAARLIATEGAAICQLDRFRLTAAADDYAKVLAAADEQVQAALAPIPEEQRALVTNHESMGYWAERYGFEIIGAVIPGGSTLAEPSAGELAGLAEVLRARRVPAIFAETTEPAKLAEALARETGGDVRIVELYTEALGEPGSGADTLAGLLVTNARRIADGLGFPPADAAGTPGTGATPGSAPTPSGAGG